MANPLIFHAALAPDPGYFQLHLEVAWNFRPENAFDVDELMELNSSTIFGKLIYVVNFRTIHGIDSDRFEIYTYKYDLSLYDLTRFLLPRRVFCCPTVLTPQLSGQALLQTS